MRKARIAFIRGLCSKALQARIIRLVAFISHNTISS